MQPKTLKENFILFTQLITHPYIQIFFKHSSSSTSVFYKATLGALALGNKVFETLK
jgi:hypothetical protein